TGTDPGGTVTTVGVGPRSLSAVGASTVPSSTGAGFLAPFLAPIGSSRIVSALSEGSGADDPSAGMFGKATPPAAPVEGARTGGAGTETGGRAGSGGRGNTRGGAGSGASSGSISVIRSESSSSPNSLVRCGGRGGGLRLGDLEGGLGAAERDCGAGRK